MKRCCCNSSTVRTGTLIIGVLTLISAIYQVGKSCLELTVAVQQLCTLKDQSARQIKYPDYSDDKIDKLTSALEVGIGISSAFLVISLIQFCLTISLLRGVGKDNYRLILPWYYYNLVMFVVIVVATAGITIGLLIKGQRGAVLFAAIAATLIFGIWWLSLLVVKDYINELRTGSQRDNSKTVIYSITAATGKTETA